jgi:hypothetical protein
VWEGSGGTTAGGREHGATAPGRAPPAPPPPPPSLAPSQTGCHRACLTGCVALAGRPRSGVLACTQASKLGVPDPCSRCGMGYQAAPGVLGCKLGVRPATCPPLLTSLTASATASAQASATATATATATALALVPAPLAVNVRVNAASCAVAYAALNVGRVRQQIAARAGARGVTVNEQRVRLRVACLPDVPPNLNLLLDATVDTASVGEASMVRGRGSDGGVIAGCFTSSLPMHREESRVRRLAGARRGACVREQLILGSSVPPWPCAGVYRWQHARGRGGK